MKEKCVLFDFDGTLSNLNHRLHLVKDKSKFHNLCDCDMPDLAIMNLCKALSHSYKIIIATCRPESVREKSEYWLKKYNVPYTELILRDDNDDRPDDVIKLDFIKYISKKYDIEFAVDDRDKVVKMFRENGIKCLQVDYGDF